MSWKCPQCGSQDLEVAVYTAAKLTQSDGNFETEIIGDHEWNDDSRMTCRSCEFSDAASAFEEKPPVALHCPHCGSTDIVRDATAVWNAEKQDWELCGVQDIMTCSDCGEEFFEAKEIQQ